MPASLTSLPTELLTQIAEYLSLEELCQLKSTTKFFQPVVNNLLIKKLVQVLLEEVQQIIAGADHTFFIKTDGTVWACGNNNSGQLGIGNRPLSKPIFQFQNCKFLQLN